MELADARQHRSSRPASRERRSFLIRMGGAGTARSGAALLAPGAALLRSGKATAQPRETLIQPSQLSSENGILSTTITAAPGRVHLGDLAFPGRLYNGSP
jgi:hypothetical protein